MSRAFLSAVLGFVLFAGCHGPKGSPEGTVESFYSAAESHDWEAMAGMIHPDSMRKVGPPPRVAAFYAAIYEHCNDVDVSIEESLITRPDAEAVVRFKCTATFRALGQQAYERSCSDTISLRTHNGKWYIVLTETQPLRPTL